MIRNVGYMKNLVVKTIELAKLNSPNTHFHYQSINLSEIIQQTLESNQLLFNEKSIDINCNLSRDIFINADQLRIEELLNNLLNNAVKYSDRNGSIIIDALESNGMVTISLKDTGIGMTKDQIEHIFDEFYKADTSRHDFDSSGLGMPIAKRIVEKHGGRIWVESEGIDKGSTFYFSLPIELNNQINNGKSYDDITSSIDNLFKN
jgi:signal transduction histidine kinase